MTEHGLPLAEYLAGELDAEQTAAVDEHLVSCDACWSEVHIARLGQLAAQRTTETAPDETRHRVLTRVADAAASASNGGIGHRLVSRSQAASTPSSYPRRRLMAGFGAAVVAAVIFGAGLLIGHGTSPRPAAVPSRPPTATPSSPAPAMGTLAAALSYYRLATLPGTGLATAPAPDLRTLGLRVAGASNGTLAAQPVTAYAYRNAVGSRQIYVFVSATPFRSLAPTGGAPTQTRSVRGYTIFANARRPMIIVGQDPDLVDKIGTRLG